MVDAYEQEQQALHDQRKREHAELVRLRAMVAELRAALEVECERCAKIADAYAIGAANMDCRAEELTAKQLAGMIRSSGQHEPQNDGCPGG